MNRFFLLYLTLFCLLASCSSSEKQSPDITDFSNLLLPAAKDGGFNMEDYWIWGGSAIKGPDGQYHLFASRWPKQYPFNQGYVYHSQVVHAVSEKPEGPYRFKDVALPRRPGYSLGPYRRALQEPIATAIVEDPFVWKQDSTFYILAKDMEGNITGEKHAGVFLTAKDLTQWKLGENPKAYSRTVRWTDGTQTMQGSFERPQLLIQNGKPTHLFAATADGPGGFRNAENTWNMVVPLKQLEE